VPRLFDTLIQAFPDVQSIFDCWTNAAAPVVQAPARVNKVSLSSTTVETKQNSEGEKTSKKANKKPNMEADIVDSKMSIV